MKAFVVDEYELRRLRAGDEDFEIETPEIPDDSNLDEVYWVDCGEIVGLVVDAAVVATARVRKVTTKIGTGAQRVRFADVRPLDETIPVVPPRVVVLPEWSEFLIPNG